MKAQNPVLDVADWAYPVEGLGPGRRMVLWVRGCGLACPGCMTPELWEAGVPHQYQRVDEIAEKLAGVLAGLDGLTISGGEPTLQSGPLTALVRNFRGMPGLEELEVLCYSGFTMEELRCQGAEVQEFLAEIDMLMDGRYVQEDANELQWRGSDNQRLHILSERAWKYAEAASSSMPEQRPLQVQLPEMGKFRIIGIPRRGDMAALRAALKDSGIQTRADMPGRRAGNS